MSEFDELLSRDGVVMAGRFGPGWRIADHKSRGLFIENPAAMELAHRFCAALTMMFDSMALAMDSVTRTGFDTASWRPLKGWSFRGGDYSIVVRGDRFVFAETKKVKSFDELRRLLGEENP